MHIRLRDTRHGQGGRHITTRIFVGPDQDHLALAGSVTLEIGEWQLFGAALWVGVDAISSRVPITLDAPDQRDGFDSIPISGQALGESEVGQEEE